MLPLSSLPLWGREGVALATTRANKQLTGK